MNLCCSIWHNHVLHYMYYTTCTCTTDKTGQLNRSAYRLPYRLSIVTGLTAFVKRPDGEERGEDFICVRLVSKSNERGLGSLTSIHGVSIAISVAWRWSSWRSSSRTLIQWHAETTEIRTFCWIHSKKFHSKEFVDVMLHLHCKTDILQTWNLPKS